jgi:hypothetical protein
MTPWVITKVSCRKITRLSNAPSPASPGSTIRGSGTREFRAFVSGTVDWLRERNATAEDMALMSTLIRTVEEVVLGLTDDQGRQAELPVAIVADRNPERTIKTIRVYHSM